MTTMDDIRALDAEYAALRKQLGPIDNWSMIMRTRHQPLRLELGDSVDTLLDEIKRLQAENERLTSDAEYGTYCRAVYEAYKNSSSKVRPLEYEKWLPIKDEATAWLYAVPLWQDEQAEKAKAAGPPPETNLSDYVICPCCRGERYADDGGECGYCDATGAVSRETFAAIAAEGGCE